MRFLRSFFVSSFSSLAILSAFLCAAALLVVPTAASANTPSGAYSDCMAAASYLASLSYAHTYGYVASCKWDASNKQYVNGSNYGCTGASGEYTPPVDCTSPTGPYTIPTPSQACAHAWPGGAPIKIDDTFVASTMHFVGHAPAPSGGGTLNCTLAESPLGHPFVDPADGQWHQWVTVGSTGNISPGTDSTDSTGAALVPDPIPTLAPVHVTPNQACGNGACYDPLTDSFTADGSSSLSVPASAATGFGSCSSAGGSTLCAGVLPPVPTITAVPNPPASIKSSDTFTIADATTGATTSVIVNTYANPGSSVGSGKGAGDSGPAPASSAPGADKGSFAGGTSCALPPVCSGDAVMCGAARTQWATTCQIHTDLTGPTGAAPPTLVADKTKYTQADVVVPASTGNSVGDQANNGIYNQLGFGLPRDCPLTDLSLHSVASVIHFSDGCGVINWSGYLILGFALFAAAKITAGSTN